MKKTTIVVPFALRVVPRMRCPIKPLPRLSIRRFTAESFQEIWEGKMEKFVFFNKKF